MKKKIIIIFLMFFSNIFPVKSENCYSDAFLVKNVQIDENALSGQVARTKGIQKAVNKSFLIAINRMIINPPIVLEENFNGKDFLDFVHISSENTLPRRYIANVDFCFNSKLIREFLVKKKLQWSELISSEILMLPIWDDASGKRMWANNVLWLSSWRNFIKKTDSLIKFVILSPSISLERLLSPEAVSSRDKNVLKFAAKNAEAAQLILLFAYLDYSGEANYLKMVGELYNSDGTLLAILNETKLPIDGQLNLQVTFEKFQIEVKNLIELRWKKKNIYIPGKNNQIFVSVKINNFKEFYSIHNQIQSLEIVKDIYKIKLTDKVSTLKLSLAGSIEAFKFALKKSNYSLINNDTGYELVLK